MIDKEFEPITYFMKENMKEFKQSIHPDKICDYIIEIIK